MTTQPRSSTVVILASCLLAALSAQADPHVKKIVGRVVSIDGNVLVVKTKHDETVTIQLGEATKYVKWITQKPWQQNTAADASFLRVGRLVEVETTPGERTMKARVVRIATD